MNKAQGWAMGFVISAVLWGIIISGVMCVAGCSDPMLQGIAIGLGTSTASTEASELAAENKTALVAKILQLQQKLEAAATPEQQAALQGQLDAALKKQELADLTATIADTVKAGLERDWGDKPTSPDNLAWILGSAATVMGGLAGKKTLDDRKKAAVITKIKIASKSDKEREIYEAAGTA